MNPLTLRRAGAFGHCPGARAVLGPQRVYSSTRFEVF
jgi:hypothetical protein